MSRIKILTFCGIIISALGGVQSVSAGISSWSGLLSGIASGGGCDSALAQYYCTGSKCADKKKFRSCKDICKTNLMIVKHHPNCAAAAGLKAPDSDEDGNASISNKCEALWNRTKKMTRCSETASAFCEKYGEECKDSEDFSDWCQKSCDDSEPDDKA